MKTSSTGLRDVFFTTEVIRPVDYNIAPGVYPDMKEHGFEEDDWPEIQQKVMEANILIIGSPIWLGEKSSVCTKAIERLYGYSANLNKDAFRSSQSGTSVG